MSAIALRAFAQTRSRDAGLAKTNSRSGNAECVKARKARREDLFYGRIWVFKGILKDTAERFG